MMAMIVVPLTEERFDDFVQMICALADYEHLDRPDADAVARLRADAFGPIRRYEAALAVDADGRAVGYAGARLLSAPGRSLAPRVADVPHYLLTLSVSPHGRASAQLE